MLQDTPYEFSSLTPDLHLLHKFLEKIYYGEDTLVFDCFGQLVKLENEKRMFYLYDHQYLLFRKNDLTTDVRSKILGFINVIKEDIVTLSTDLTKQFARIAQIEIGEESAEVNLNVLAMKLGDLLGEREDSPLVMEILPLFKEAYFSNVKMSPDLVGEKLAILLGKASNTKQIKLLVDAFKRSDFKGNDFIFQYILSRYLYNKINSVMRTIDKQIDGYVTKIFNFLQEEKVTVSTKEFIKSEALKLIRNNYTKPSFELTCNREKAKIFLISNAVKFRRILTWDPRNFKFGTIDPAQNIIWLFFNKFMSKYPEVNLLGGVSACRNLLKEYGKPGVVVDVFGRAFLGTLAEEFFDYNSLPMLEKESENIRILQQFEISLSNLSDFLVEQEKIANLILNKQEHQLSLPQIAIWENIKKAIALVIKNAAKEPVCHITAVPETAKVNEWFSLSGALPGINIQVKLKKFLGEEMSIFFGEEYQNLPKSLRVALLEAPPVEQDISEMQIASLCLSIVQSIQEEVDVINELYGGVDFQREMAGKLQKYYIYFPGYLEIALADFDKNYQQIIALVGKSTEAIYSVEIANSQNRQEAWENKKALPLAMHKLARADNETYNGLYQSLALIKKPIKSLQRNSATFFLASGNELFPYDRGYWSETIELEQDNQLPIFTYVAEKNFKVVGKAKFIGHPLLCLIKMNAEDNIDDVSHNIIDATGVFIKIVNELDKTKIAEICAFQPLTYTQRLTGIALDSAGFGGLLGGRDVGQTVFMQLGCSKPLAYFVADIGFYATFFYLRLRTELKKTDDLNQAMQAAALYTLRCASVKVSMDTLAVFGGLLIKYGYKISGSLLYGFGNLAVLSYQAMTNPTVALADLTIGTFCRGSIRLAGNITISLVKIGAKYLYNAIKIPFHSKVDIETPKVHLKM